jgi:hypothetical protein
LTERPAGNKVWEKLQQDKILRLFMICFISAAGRLFFPGKPYSLKIEIFIGLVQEPRGSLPSLLNLPHNGGKFSIGIERGFNRVRYHCARLGN